MKIDCLICNDKAKLIKETTKRKYYKCEYCGTRWSIKAGLLIK